MWRRSCRPGLSLHLPASTDAPEGARDCGRYALRGKPGSGAPAGARGVLPPGPRSPPLGLPLAMHRWHEDALGLLSRHRKVLLPLRVALLVRPMIPTIHRSGRTCQRLDKELAKSAWLKPLAVELSSGRFDPALLRVPPPKACWVGAGERNRRLGSNPGLSQQAASGPSILHPRQAQDCILIVAGGGAEAWCWWSLPGYGWVVVPSAYRARYASEGSGWRTKNP